jgi:hypothetical protein
MTEVAQQPMMQEDMQLEGDDEEVQVRTVFFWRR